MKCGKESPANPARPQPSRANPPTVNPAATPGAAVSPKRRLRRTRPAADPRPHSRRLPPYAVIVLNDEVHTFPYVIETLQKVFGYGWFKAMLLTVKIHTRGRASVWTGPLEVAEFKRERIVGFGPDVYALRRVEFPLGCEIEPLA
jgi:ATP-dependent Clp protease adaptor protein ClpS